MTAKKTAKKTPQKPTRQVVPLCPECKRVYHSTNYVRERMNKVIAQIRACARDLDRYYFAGPMYNIATAISDLKEVHEQLTRLNREEETARHQASMPTHHESKVAP
jgi:hypothetical protein